MSTRSEDESAASTVAVADTETGADVATGTEAGPGTEVVPAAAPGPAPDAATGPAADISADAGATSGSARERGRRWWVAWLIRLAWLAGLIAVGIGLYLCYLYISRTARVSSDGASNALQAWGMLHGNPLLRGWTVTDVSFYTTELPEYMLVEYFRGLNADVLHVSAAISYTLVVLTGAMLARGRATGREGIVRMLIAAGIMIAPQLGPGVFILVFQPDHIGTQAPLLLTWLVLDRAPRQWWVPLLVGGMLAWVEIADRLALLIAIAPLAAVSAVRAYQVLVQRREGLRAAWFDLSLLVAAVSTAVSLSCRSRTRWPPLPRCRRIPGWRWRASSGSTAPTSSASPRLALPPASRSCT